MSKKKQVTFADIAEYTNFSKTTISRYFNHPDSLTLENQEKISQLLTHLDIKRISWQKVLANGKSEFIGIIVPNLYLHYYSEMLTQFLSSYRDYHYKFLVFVSEHGAEEEQQYIEELLSYQIEGLIVLSHTLPSEKLASYQIPVIAIEREAEHISSVNTDNYMGASDILIHINVNVNKSAPAYDRIWAFQATCEEYHVPYDIDLSVKGASYHELLDVIREIFNKINQNITIFFFNGFRCFLRNRKFQNTVFIFCMNVFFAYCIAYIKASAHAARIAFTSDIITFFIFFIFIQSLWQQKVPDNHLSAEP